MDTVETPVVHVSCNRRCLREVPVLHITNATDSERIPALTEPLRRGTGLSRSLSHPWDRCHRPISAASVPPLTVYSADEICPIRGELRTPPILLILNGSPH